MAKSMTIDEIFKEQLKMTNGDERKAAELSLSLGSFGLFDAVEGQARENAIDKFLEEFGSSKGKKQKKVEPKVSEDEEPENPEDEEALIPNLQESYIRENEQGKIPAKGIKTIDVDAKEWFDKVNGNSYFSGTITINYGMKDEKIIKMPYEYGYGDYYTQAARSYFEGDPMISLHRWCQSNGIILRTRKTKVTRKKDLMESRKYKKKDGREGVEGEDYEVIDFIEGEFGNYGFIIYYFFEDDVYQVSREDGMFSVDFSDEDDARKYVDKRIKEKTNMKDLTEGRSINENFSDGEGNYGTSYGDINITFTHWDNKSSGEMMMTALPGFNGKELLEDIEDKGIAYVEDEILSGMLGNGWTTVNPEEIGALTSAPIISADFEYLNDNSDEKKHYTVCAYMDYQVKSFAEELATKGKAFWQAEKLQEESKSRRIPMKKKYKKEDFVDLQFPLAKDNLKKKDAKDPKGSTIYKTTIASEDGTIRLNDQIDKMERQLMDIAQNLPIGALKFTDKAKKKLDNIINYCNILKEIK